MRYASAQTVADQLLEIAGERDVPYVSSDERLNAVLLRVRPGETEHVRALVDRLDRPARGIGRHPGAEAALCRPGGARRAAPGAARRTPGRRPIRPRAAVVGLRGRAFEVVADVPTHSLVVPRPPETVDAVLDVVAELDRVPPSVRVEITVAALELDDRLDLGTDFLIPSITHANSPDDLIATVAANPSGGGDPDASERREAVRGRLHEGAAAGDADRSDHGQSVHDLDSARERLDHDERPRRAHGSADAAASS